MEIKVSECVRRNLCVDCDNTNCWFYGSIMADCPKYHCDRVEDLFEDCESCAFIKEFQEDMRKIYAEEI